jgi:hypothetical protein
MSLDPVTAALDIGGKLIDRLWPDPAQADAAKLELLRLQQSGELAQISGQLEINKVEAASGSVFVAGWRPYIGWVCGTGLAYQFLVYPVAVAFIPKIVQLDMGTLLTLLAGMLGFGAMRTQEKLNGVATK